MRRRDRDGFSLVEVTMALMVVALGLLALFHLFPSGLRASYDATAETRVSQFAEEVLNALRAETAAETDPVRWRDKFNAELNVGQGDGVPVSLRGGWSEALEYPAGSAEWLRYYPRMSFSTNLAKVTLQIKYGKAGGVTHAFYTEMYRYGM